MPGIVRIPSTVYSLVKRMRVDLHEREEETDGHLQADPFGGVS